MIIVIIGNPKKYRGNAFSDKDLTQVLKEAEIKEIELVGVNGGDCVAHTALWTLKKGIMYNKHQSSWCDVC